MCLMNFPACLVLFESSGFYFDSISSPAANATSSHSFQARMGQERKSLQSNSPGMGDSLSLMVPKEETCRGNSGPAFALFPTSNYWRRVLSYCACDRLLEMFTTHAWPAVCHIPSSPSPTLAPTSLTLYHAPIFSLFLPLPWWALIISWVLKRNSDQFPAFSGKETGLERGSNWFKVNTASFIYSLNQEHALLFKI